MPNITAKAIPDYAPLRLVDEFHQPRRMHRNSSGISPESGDDIRFDAIGRMLEYSSRFIVYGAAGSGKTTLFRWLTGGLALLQANHLDDDFPDRQSLPRIPLRPVPINCARLNRGKPVIDLRQLICLGLESALVPPTVIDSRIEEFENPSDVIQPIILLDGFDQMSKEWQKAVVLACDHSLNPKVRVIINARPEREVINLFRSLALHHFPSFSIRPLDKRDIATFVSGWFQRKYPSDPSPDKLLERAKQWSDSLGCHFFLADIVRTPMCLVAALVAHGRSGPLPSWHEYYRAAIESHWSHRRPDYPLSRDEVFPQLGAIALGDIDSDSTFRQDAALARLRAVREQAKPKNPFGRRSPQAFLDAMVECGLLDREEPMIDRGGILYRFASKPIQAYLAFAEILSCTREDAVGTEDWLVAYLARVNRLPTCSISLSTGANCEDVTIGPPWTELLRMYLTPFAQEEQVDVLRRILAGCDRDPQLAPRRRVGLVAAYLLEAAAEVRAAAAPALVSCIGRQANLNDCAGDVPETDFARIVSELFELDGFGGPLRGELLGWYLNDQDAHWRKASFLLNHLLAKHSRLSEPSTYQYALERFAAEGSRESGGWLVRYLSRVDQLPSRTISLPGGGVSEDVTIGPPWTELLRMYLTPFAQEEQVDVLRRILAGCDRDPQLAPRRRVGLVAAYLLEAAAEVRAAAAPALVSCIGRQVNLNDYSAVAPGTDFAQVVSVLSTLDDFGVRLRGELLSQYLNDNDPHWRNASQFLLRLLSENAPITGPSTYRHTVDQLADDIPIATSAALRLVDYYYRGSVTKTSLEPPLAEVQALAVDTLFHLAASPTSALSYAAIWALGWAGRARVRDDQVGAWWKPSPSDLVRLIEIARRDNGPGTGEILFWIYNLLSTYRDNTGDQDIILEWAHVADGKRNDLPPTSVSNPLSDPEVIALLQNGLFHLNPRTRGAAALALGRLGHFQAEMVEPLATLIQPAIETSRVEEALKFLAFTGSDQAGDVLLDAMEDARLYSLAFLGLIGLGQPTHLLRIIDTVRYSVREKQSAIFGLLATKRIDGKRLVLDRLKSAAPEALLLSRSLLIWVTGSNASNEIAVLLGPEGSAQTEHQRNQARIVEFLTRDSDDEYLSDAPDTIDSSRLIIPITKYLAAEFEDPSVCPIVEPILVEMSRNKSPLVRSAVLEFCSADFVYSHADIFLSATKDQNESIRAKSIEKLIAVNHPSGREVFAEALRDGTEILRAILTGYLAERADPSDSNLLREAMRDESLVVRTNALRTVAQLLGDFALILLSRNCDKKAPWLDPKKPVSLTHRLNAVERSPTATGSTVEKTIDELTRSWGLRFEGISTAD